MKNMEVTATIDARELVEKLTELLGKCNGNTFDVVLTAKVTHTEMGLDNQSVKENTLLASLESQGLKYTPLKREETFLVGSDFLTR